MAEDVRAWRPHGGAVREVLHATFQEHAYPAHTHDDWTVLLLDEGAVSYSLDRRERRAEPASVTLLPPHVPHDGRTAQDGRPFRKRVLYVEESWLPAAAVAAAVTRPVVHDPAVVAALSRVHVALGDPAGALAAECELLALQRAIGTHLGGPGSVTTDAPLARRLRVLLDDRLSEPPTMAEAGALLGAHPGHLVRVFSQSYGIPPHRYVVGRRLDQARRLLLQGVRPAEVAARTGFHDQAHLTRHFRRLLATTPGAFAGAAGDERATAGRG